MTTNNAKSLSYACSGVDIEAGNELVEHIKPLAKSTNRTGCMSSIGGFGGLFDLQKAGYDNPIIVSATDGVGTKLRVALDAKNHKNVGIDLVAMCVNDLIVQGAEPLFFLDYFACGKLDITQATEVISGIAKGCKISGSALIGGETAEMPGMYEAEDYDLAGFAVGAVDRDKILPKTDDIKSGDVLIGIASDGFHSNGFSLVRKIMQKANLDCDSPVPFDSTAKMADMLLRPTKIYVASCLKAIRETGNIKALAHITGGGLSENIPRILPDNISAKIDLNSWKLPAEFAWAMEAGNITETEMLKTFNSGIGMVAICEAEHADEIRSILEGEGEQTFIIGQLENNNDKASSVSYTGSLI